MRRLLKEPAIIGDFGSWPAFGILPAGIRAPDGMPIVRLPNENPRLPCANASGIAPNNNSSTAASAANAVAFGQNRDGDLVEQPFAHGAMGIFPERGRAPPPQPASAGKPGAALTSGER